MTKKLVGIVLAAIMVVSLLPTVALAEWSGTGTGTQSDPWKIGTTGNENTVTAYLDDGTLTIEGTGAMQDFKNDGAQPWYSSNKTIDTVNIEEGVTEIGNWAFGAFSSLANVTIPSSVTVIGERAFYECTSLTSVTIPSGVTSIEDWAFRKSGLTRIDIPANVAVIGDAAFDECASLAQISVEGSNMAYSSADNVLFNKDKTTLICFPPANNVTTYTIPDTVKSISIEAFRGCSGLTGVIIPSSVTDIGTHAFIYCTGLTKADIPEKVTSIGLSTFYGCSNLTEVKIPSGVTSIGKFAFNGCTSLESVTSLATTPPTLDSTAFTSCTKLTSIFVPEPSVAAYKAASGWNAYADKIVGEHIVDGVIFEKWTNNGSLPTTVGNYYLDADVKISSTWNVPTGATPTNLDLNGWVIEKTGNGSVIRVDDGATLNLYDCGTTKHYFTVGNNGLWTLTDTVTENYVTGGIITGGNNTDPDSDGGGVFISNGGSLTMNGGNIIGNKALNGGGVCLSSSWDTFVMNGGLICGNFAVTGGGVFYSIEECLAAGTPITLANGETEFIENLQKGAAVEVFDHETGTTASAVLFDIWKYPEKKDGAAKLHFSNRIDVTVVGGHCFYEKEAKKYISVTKYNANDYIGHEFYNMDSARWEKLEGVTYLSEAVDTYVIVSEKNLNCAANGMLSAEDGIYELLINVFDFDNEMKINQQQKAAAIRQHGEWTIADCPDMSESAFDALNFRYMPIIFAKGGITPKQFEELAEYSLLIDPELYSANAQPRLTLLGSQRPLMLLSAEPEIVTGLAFGGTAKVYENKNGNVYLAGGRSLTVGTGNNNVSAPKAGMNVWVTMEAETGKFTLNGNPGDADKFHADNTDYQVQFNTGEGKSWLELAVKPTPVYDAPDPSVSIPASHGDASVNLKATVSGSNAALKEITDNNLKKLLEDADSDTIVLDLSGLSKSIKSVSISKKSLEKIEAEMQKEDSNVDGLTINMPGGTILLPEDCVTEILNQAEGDTIKFSLESIKKTKLTSAQKEAVGKFDNAELFDISLTSNGKKICTKELGGFGGEDVFILLPYEMKEGENEHNTKVYYVAEDGSLENIPALYIEGAKEFILEVEHLSVYAVLYSENAPENCARDSGCPLHAFSDVNMNLWYHDGVHYCLANGIMQGKRAEIFAPMDNISRAEIVQMLWNLEGQPYVNYYMQYSDVEEGKWYTEAIRWAAAEKLIQGYPDGEFKPSRNITREELAVILFKYAKYKGVDTEKMSEDVNTLSFNDIFEVNSWAAEAMHFSIAADIIQGNGKDCVLPKANASRAEAAIMIYRFCEMLK